MNQYTDFAAIYDRLMTADVDYRAWCAYLEKLFEKNGCAPSLVLELGCGTGSMTVALAKRGYSMIGLDISTDMLNIAGQKARDEGLDILYLNQDMADFELYGTVDAVVCTLDGLNYLTEDGDLERTFSLVELYLNPGGIFVFDLNTEHKIRNVIAPQTFLYDTEDVFYTWQSELDGELCDYYLTFFVRQEDGAYRRFDETHTQRIYTPSAVERALASSGLKLTDCYDALTFDAADVDCERVFYTAVKK